MTTNVKAGAQPPHRVIEPSTGEHGVWGYTKGAVGGFGENYDAQAAHGETSDEGGPKTADDIALEDAVRKSLAHAHIDAADLRVEVNGGEGRLYGTVRQQLEKSELEARARAVPGVVAVKSWVSLFETETR